MLYIKLPVPLLFQQLVYAVAIFKGSMQSLKLWAESHYVYKSFPVLYWCLLKFTHIPVILVIAEFLWSMAEMNAKGIILQAFDQFRIKSCIDFKPQDSERYFLSMVKLNGYVLCFILPQ